MLLTLRVLIAKHYGKLRLELKLPDAAVIEDEIDVLFRLVVEVVCAVVKLAVNKAILGIDVVIGVVGAPFFFNFILISSSFINNKFN